MCYRQVPARYASESSTPTPLDFPNNVVGVGQGRIPQPRPPSNQKAEKLNDLSGIGSPPFCFQVEVKSRRTNPPIPAMTTNTTQCLPPGHWSPPPLNVLPSYLRPFGSTWGSTGRRGANAPCCRPSKMSAGRRRPTVSRRALSGVCVATRHGNKAHTIITGKIC